MKVAILSAAPAPNHGWGRHALELCTALGDAGIEITFITARDAQTDPPFRVAQRDPRAKLMRRGKTLLPDQFRDDYYRVLPTLTPAGRLLSLRLLLARPLVRVLTQDADLIHVLSEPYALTTPETVGKKPTVVTAHGTYLPQTTTRRIVGALYRRIYENSRIICVSKFTEAQVLQSVPNAQPVVIPNGVRIPDSNGNEISSPTKTGPVILTIGQVKPRKGYHLLAQALPIIRAQVPNVQLVFIGDLSDKAYVQSVVDELNQNGTADAVTWLGTVTEEDKEHWYRSADIFALPNVTAADGKFEGFGLVHLEASAHGLPTVGTFGSGGEEAIRNGETGLLVPPDDPGMLANALIRLLSDPDLRLRMGNAGRLWAAQNSWDLVATRTIREYKRVIEQEAEARQGK